MRVQWSGYAGRKKAEIVLDEEDATFVYTELVTCAPNDGFVRDLWKALNEAWPEHEGEA